MTVDTNSERTRISDRVGDSNKLADAEDISGGVEHGVGNVDSVSVFLSAEGAVDVKVELSPDAGRTWYTVPEGPVEFGAAGESIVHLEYNATGIRLTGTNGTAVTAKVREVV